MEVATLWHEISELNRKFAIAVTYGSFGEGLGCHCGTITNVYAQFGYGMYAPNNGRSIEVLDTNKEPQLVYTPQMGMLYRKHEPPLEESKKIIEYIKTHDFTDLLSEIYKKVVESCSRNPIWVLSDVVNRGSQVRETNVIFAGNKGTEDSIYYIGTTAGFVKYLIDNKIGYILASPIVQNPLHRHPKDYSINRAWIWIPPDHLSRTLDSAEQHGVDRIPSKLEWAKVVENDLEVFTKDPISYCTRVFTDGQYPDNRFRREGE